MPPGSGADDQPDVASRIDTVLGEFRMIIPALGALFGFQLTAAFSAEWKDLAPLLKTLNFAGVLSTAVALVLLLVPASYHRFTHRLDESEGYLRFAQRNMGVAFVFITLSLALSVFVQAVRAFGSAPAALASSGAFLLLAVAAWWVLPRRRAARKGREGRRPAGRG